MPNLFEMLDDYEDNVTLVESPLMGQIIPFSHQHKVNAKNFMEIDHYYPLSDACFKKEWRSC